MNHEQELKELRQELSNVKVGEHSKQEVAKLEMMIKKVEDSKEKLGKNKFVRARFIIAIQTFLINYKKRKSKEANHE